MMQKAQSVVVVVLAAVIGVLTSQLMDARRRIEALEREVPTALAPAGSAGTSTSSGGVRGPSDAELRALKLRIAELEDRVDTDPDRAEADNADEPAGAAPLARDKDAEPKGELQQLVKKELERAEQERDTTRAERLRARTVQKVTELADAVKLSGEQKQKLTDMLDAEQQELRALFRDGRESGDFGGLRDTVRAARAKTDENAKAVLDDEQFDAYAKMRDEERSRFLGGGDR